MQRRQFLTGALLTAAGALAAAPARAAADGPWFDLKPATDDSVFRTASYVRPMVMRLAASADEVWAGLVADRPLAWCTALDGHYTSARPFGVGTTRFVTVDRVLHLRERFFLWNEAERRHAFTVLQTNLPLFSEFAEDYRVEPIDGGCRFSWTIAFSPNKATAPVLPAVFPIMSKTLMDGLVRDTERHFGTI
ncbi:SRPBCC family protein [Pseudonocardiaceae bacterium YIM PH 21723]|nr:SRPBCC family protein [Pseudonocardiaceae bacterium YIM PH 21723]